MIDDPCPETDEARAHAKQGSKIALLRRLYGFPTGSAQNPFAMLRKHKQEIATASTQTPFASDRMEAVTQAIREH